MPNPNRYTRIVSQTFLDDLKKIRDNKLVDPKDWGLFREQLRQEWEDLDEKWEKISRQTMYPPLSTYDYRKRYMHSIPVNLKQRRKWENNSSDFRIIFKIREIEKEIFYLGIGKRIKVLPKDPDDIWEVLKDRPLPEEE